MKPISDLEMAEMAQILDAHGVEGESTTYALVLLLREVRRARAENARFREALKSVREALTTGEHDTVWLPEDVALNMTAVECIDAALSGEVKK